MYQDVTNYFTEEYPTLIPMLDSTGVFWTRIKDNSFTNEQLVEEIKFDVRTKVDPSASATFSATIALACGRLTGKIKNPG